MSEHQRELSAAFNRLYKEMMSKKTIPTKLRPVKIDVGIRRRWRQMMKSSLTWGFPHLSSSQTSVDNDVSHQDIFAASYGETTPHTAGMSSEGVELQQYEELGSVVIHDLTQGEEDLLPTHSTDGLNHDLLPTHSADNHGSNRAGESDNQDELLGTNTSGCVVLEEQKKDVVLVDWTDRCNDEDNIVVQDVTYSHADAALHQTVRTSSDVHTSCDVAHDKVVEKHCVVESSMDRSVILTETDTDSGLATSYMSHSDLLSYNDQSLARNSQPARASLQVAQGKTPSSYVIDRCSTSFTIPSQSKDVDGSSSRKGPGVVITNHSGDAIFMQQSPDTDKHSTEHLTPSTDTHARSGDCSRSYEDVSEVYVYVPPSPPIDALHSPPLDALHSDFSNDSTHSGYCKTPRKVIIPAKSTWKHKQSKHRSKKSNTPLHTGKIRQSQGAEKPRSKSEHSTKTHHRTIKHKSKAKPTSKSKEKYDEILTLHEQSPQVKHTKFSKSSDVKKDRKTHAHKSGSSNRHKDKLMLTSKHKAHPHYTCHNKPAKAKKAAPQLNNTMVATKSLHALSALDRADTGYPSWQPPSATSLNSLFATSDTGHVGGAWKNIVEEL